jgi:hypothetical protein
MSDAARSPEIIWQTAYGELQLQLPMSLVAQLATWLIAHEDGTYHRRAQYLRAVVGAPAQESSCEP